MTGKKIFTLLLAIVLVIGCVGINAGAQDELIPFSSNYISSTNASLSAVGNGKIKITGRETATGVMTSLGISVIRIYKSDGTFVTRIYGSTANGLIRENASTYSGSYTYQGAAGTSYYAIVTFVARNSSGSDTYDMTTSVVKA